MSQNSDASTLLAKARVSIPTPRYRHATPSGPWPFLDLRDDVPTEQIEPRPKQGTCKHLVEVVKCNECLNGYPQSLFPNWTSKQQVKSGIDTVAGRRHPCTLLHVEMSIDQNGASFSTPGTICVNETNCEEAANNLRELQSQKAETRAIFVDGISGPTLKMLGTIFDIEPFYFSSSIGWTPSRFQESLDRDLKSDHITLTLRFVSKIPKPVQKHEPTSKIGVGKRSRIDVYEPLILGDCALQPDLLAFHVVRSKGNNTIISYHCSERYGSTSAADLCTRLQLVARSVYWSKIFKEYLDPTFVVVSMLWYALYSWDEAMQGLYDKICKMESQVMGTLDPYQMTTITNELHGIRAHMLYYRSLLADFQKAVTFVLKTHNPAMEDAKNKEEMQKVMQKECDHILHGIRRVEKDCEMQDLRLKNVMDLGFSRLNIEDSRQTTKLTEASLRDSAAMKQISYLTMVFLPATFTSSVFGINVVEINPTSNPRLWAYIATAVTITFITIWLVGAMQLPYMAHDVNPSAAQAQGQNGYKWSRLWWPVILIQTSLTDKAENRRIRGLEYE
ncbi:hypothetical protein APHAL10511_005171 [Amanita phalloides]|nr:hypothetical protein APHAL10511_005171 [Amanita phalloides]